MDSLLKGNVIPTAEAGEGCSQIPQDGLVASYLLQGTAEDETGSYDGTEVGSLTYAYDDERGVVATLDGTDDYISTSNTSFTNNNSFCGWVYQTGTSIAFATNAHATNYYGVQIYSSGTTLYIREGNGGTSVSANRRVYIASGTFPNDEWVFIAMVYVGYNDFDLYINGSIRSTAYSSGDATSVSFTGGEFRLGNLGGVLFHDGKFSNTHIYNRALTPTEVTDIYNLEKYHHNNTLAHGLVAYYPLDGNSLDNAINQDDGTDSNVTYPTDGDMGVVAEFNGSSSKIDVGAMGLSASDYTLMTWFKSTINSLDTLMTMQADSYGHIKLRGDQSGKVFAQDGVESLTSTTTGFNDGEWHCAVYKKTDGLAKLYVDGLLEATASTSRNNSAISGYSLLGAYNSGTTTVQFFDGRLAKTRYYDRGLSQKEIEWLYDFEKPASTECPHNLTINNPDPFEDGSGIALYKMDGNVNDTTGDYDGTPTDVTYGDGEFGECAVFNGSSSKITMPAGSPFADEATIKAISGWFKFTVSADGSRAVFLSLSSTTDANDYVIFHILDDGRVMISGRANSSSDQFSDVVTWSFDSNWHHVVYQLDGDREVYLDGVLKTTTFTNTGTATNSSWINYPAYSTAVASYIGLSRAVSGTYAKGQKEQIRLFNRALTTDEVTILANERKV